MIKNKNNKKANTGVIITLMIVLLAVVIGGMVYMSKSLSVSGGSSPVKSLGEANAGFSAVSTNLGSDFEAKVEKLRIESSALTSAKQTLSLNLTALRKDTLEDLTSGGKKFTIKVSGLTGYDSWNTSVTQKVYFVTYDSSTSKYSVTVNGEASGTLESVVAIGTSSVTIPLTIEIPSLADANNIVKTQYVGKDIAKVEIFNPSGNSVDSYGIEYFRTTATI